MCNRFQKFINSQELHYLQHMQTSYATSMKLKRLPHIANKIDTDFLKAIVQRASYWVINPRNVQKYDSSEDNLNSSSQSESENDDPFDGNLDQNRLPNRSNFSNMINEALLLLDQENQLVRQDEDESGDGIIIAGSELTLTEQSDDSSIPEIKVIRFKKILQLLPNFKYQQFSIEDCLDIDFSGLKCSNSQKQQLLNSIYTNKWEVEVRERNHGPAFGLMVAESDENGSLSEENINRHLRHYQFKLEVVSIYQVNAEGEKEGCQLVIMDDCRRLAYFRIQSGCLEKPICENYAALSRWNAVEFNF